MSMRLAFAGVLILVSSFATAQGSDFDKVCSYFEKLQSELASKKMNNSEKADFVRKQVNKNLKKNSPAREAFELVLHAEAAVRYELYQDSAKEVNKADWQCKAMQALLPSTGEY